MAPNDDEQPKSGRQLTADEERWIRKDVRALVQGRINFFDVPGRELARLAERDLKNLSLPEGGGGRAITKVSRLFSARPALRDLVKEPASVRVAREELDRVMRGPTFQRAAQRGYFKDLTEVIEQRYTSAPVAGGSALWLDPQRSGGRISEAPTVGVPAPPSAGVPTAGDPSTIGVALGHPGHDGGPAPSAPSGQAPVPLGAPQHVERYLNRPLPPPPGAVHPSDPGRRLPAGTPGAAHLRSGTTTTTAAGAAPSAGPAPSGDPGKAVPARTR